MPTEAPAEAAAQPAATPPPVTPSALAAEVRLLDEARDALSANDGPRALDALHRYARQFPAGTLNLEATVLRIEALFMTGASSQAASLGHDFLSAHPTSTHAARVRRLLAEHTKP
jgi:outer membrane protein assembly factor BamD (BamD/ComL family)